MDILVADDDAVTRRTLEGLLTRWGYRVHTFTNGVSAWECLSVEGAPTLAVVDWMMPGMSGLDLCNRIRRLAQSARSNADSPPAGLAYLPSGHRPYTYIMILTAREHREDMIAGLEAGADDYLVKPVNPLELRARLQTGRRIVDLERELLATQSALYEKATRDALTGLWNRGAILEILDREVARLARHPAPLSLLLVDLDHFKSINDTLGHPAGDAVLRETARRMRAGLRRSDWIGRYGGEEFLIVQPGCSLRLGGEVADRLRRTVAEAPMLLPEGEARITLSIGTVAAGPDREVVTAWQLIKEADTALYQAKQRGRNRVVLAPSLAEVVDLSDTVTL